MARRFLQSCRIPRHCRRLLVALAVPLLLIGAAQLAMGQPRHATPAPTDQPGAAPAPTPMPLSTQPGAGPAGAPLAPPPGTQLAPPAGTVPPPAAAVPPPAAGATPPPAGAAPTPATAPQVLYEAAPTTQSVRRMGGAVGEEAGGAPLPTTAPESPKVSILVRGRSVEEIFNMIRQKTGVRVQALGSTGQKKMDLNVRDLPVETVVDQIAKANGWQWVQNIDGSYDVMDAEAYRAWRGQQVRIKSYQLHFIDADEMLKVVQPLLTPEVGAVAADARSNKLIVTDLPSKIALVESILREYDVQVYTHVFEIRNAAVDTIREQLETVKSKAGEMFVDPVSRTIIVKDTFDKIKMMEQLVQILDREVEMRVYNMLNIGVDNEAVDEFVGKFIEPLKSASDTAVMEYNKETGKLFVRDVRSVHEKIMQILRQVDVPRKQVRIEGEIVSVALNHDLQIGTTWQYSHNLKDALGNPLVNSGSSNTTGSTSNVFNKAGLPFISGGSSGLNIVELTDNIKIELNAALSDTRTRLLLRPRITIANNEEGLFNVTQDQPVLQTFNTGYYNNAYNSSGQVTYRSGLQVRIRPTISNRGLVEMEVEFINSTPIIVPDIGNGIRGVGSSEESANTVLIVPSGETRVIGGLISRSNDEGNSGIPYLSQIPYVGWLFGKRSDTRNMRNLMFFITPTIVEEQPINDVIVEPVNPEAQASMQQAQQAAAPPATVGEIPPELRPYLKELQPEALPMPGEKATPALPPPGAVAPSGAIPGAVTPSGPVSGQISDETPMTGPQSSGAQFLSNEAYAEAPTETTAPQELRTGGALSATAQARVAGPSGVFGASAAPAGGAAKATTKPATTGRAQATKTGQAAGGVQGGTASGRSSRITERDRGATSRSRYRGMPGYGGAPGYRGETRY